MLYVDTSAFIRAFVGEREGLLVVEVLERHEAGLVSSALLEIESGRAAVRIGGGAPAAVASALERIHRVRIGPEIVASASELLPGSGLGALDAIHLATALSIPEETTVLTYDRRLQEACRQVGLAVLAPT